MAGEALSLALVMKKVARKKENEIEKSMGKVAKVRERQNEGKKNSALSFAPGSLSFFPVGAFRLLLAEL